MDILVAVEVAHEIFVFRVRTLFSGLLCVGLGWLGWVVHERDPWRNLRDRGVRI